MTAITIILTQSAFCVSSDCELSNAFLTKSIESRFSQDVTGIISTAYKMTIAITDNFSGLNGIHFLGSTLFMIINPITGIKYRSWLKSISCVASIERTNGINPRKIPESSIQITVTRNSLFIFGVLFICFPPRFLFLIMSVKCPVLPARTTI